MKEIFLTKGHVALVDDNYYEWLNQYKWCAKETKTDKIYAIAKINGEMKYMHRIIMGSPAGKDVDHKNNNGIDNQRENLRVCTRSQNQHNRMPNGKTSKHKGVSWDKTAGKYRVSISNNKKSRYLGLFKDEIEAATAYKNAAKELHGEYAYCG